MSTPADDCAVVEAGGIRFYDRYVPQLPAGDYLLGVAQRVNPKGTNVDRCYTAAQPFSVAAPRYALPPEDIFSVFPPNEAVGTFSQFLPHVVLTKRELPWELNVFGDDPKQQPPWLAVVVFAVGEQLDGGPTLLDPVLPNASARLQSAVIPAAQLFAHPHDEGVVWPALERAWYEADLDKVTASVIDLSPGAFTRIVPAKPDLAWLAHARQVDATAKADAVLRVSGDGWYSVIVANRLPGAPAPTENGTPVRSIAHLVSLEGLSHYLDGSSRLPAETKRVRMVALASWTFTCTPESGGSFAELANGLLTDAEGVHKLTAFALPVLAPPVAPQSAADAATALARGYVPTSYGTRLGERTFAWYRGPLSPVPVPSFVRAQQQSGLEWRPFGTASAALAYDPTYGTFDISYGVAWEAGRLSALADGAFARALADWQRRGHRLIDMILERRAQIKALANFDPQAPDPTVERDLLDLIESYAITDPFMTYLVTQLAAQLAPKLAIETPRSDPPLPPYPAMPSPPANPQTIADLLAEPDVQQAVRDIGGQTLDAIADWLAQRWLLVGAPFETLVPHPGLLPSESIRFFYLDANWLDALTEGALSIGIESSRDQLYVDLMRDLIRDTALNAIQDVRNKLLGKPPVPTGSAPPLDPEKMAGMLLRSALVPGWPGLEVHAYARVASGYEPDLESEIPLLRFDRLGSDVLLCLWPSVPAVVTVDEPQEGVAFGFEDPPPNQGEGLWLYPRSVDPSSYGKTLCPSAHDCQYAIDALASRIVDPATRLVKLTGPGGLIAMLESTLPGSPSLAVRDLAVQLVKVPEQAIFARQAT